MRKIASHSKAISMCVSQTIIFTYIELNDKTFILLKIHLFMS